MYRFLFRPRWIGFHLLVVVAIVAMVNLGMWQLRRLDARQAFNATVEARFDQPVVPLDDLVSGIADAGAVEWRAASATGSYLPDEQLRVVNRSQYGRPGDNVVTPLLLPDGRVLLVNRGFVPLDVEPPPPPPGTVTVTGRLHPSQERRLGQLRDPAEGELGEVQRIDIERLAPQLPGEVVPWYLDLLESSPPEADPFPEPVVEPTFGEGSHLSYAVQWFIFAICAAVGWVLAVRRSIRQRADEGRLRSADGPSGGSAAHQTDEDSRVGHDELTPN